MPDPVVFLSGLLKQLASPGSVLAGMFAAGVALRLVPFPRARCLGRRLVAVGAAALVAVTVLPVGTWLLQPLENRFAAVPPPSEPPAGIVVLGGAIDLRLSIVRGQPVVGDSAERLFALAELARRHPDLPVVFTGGAGWRLDQTTKEADLAADLLGRIGIDPARVRFERQSRSTYENANLARDLARPRPGETWLLVTSAWHMPRAVGAFRRAGWTVHPHPVDHRTAPEWSFDLGLGLAARLAALETAAHEWIGLVYYRLLGRSDSLFPGPT